MRIGRVINGTAEGPVFALSAGSSANVQHVGIFGQCRWGKTYIMMHIAAQYRRSGGVCWIIDAEDEYDVLVSAVPDAGKPLAIGPEHLLVNFFQPPGDSVGEKTWLEDICLVLRNQTYLRDGSLNLFGAVMTNMLKAKSVLPGSARHPSLAEVTARFVNLKFSGGNVRNNQWLESLNNRLSMLSNAFEAGAHVVHSNILEKLAGRSVIFRLRGLRGIPLQFVANFLLVWLARYREANPTAKPIMVLMDEKHYYAADGNRSDIGAPPMSTLIATGGKRGIRLILSNQTMGGMEDAILANLGCRIVTRLTNPRCIWTAQRSMGLTSEHAAQIPELEQREVIIQYADHPGAFKVRVDEITFPAAPGEDVLNKAAEEFLSSLDCTVDSVREEAGEETAAPELPDSDAVTGDTLQVFIRIAGTPEPIEDRCDALKMDRTREVRARRRLEAKGLTKEVEETLGKQIKFHQLTPKGLDWAKRHEIKVRQYKSGPLHEYILARVERAIGSLSPRFTFQRHSEIAREHNLQPDTTLHLPGGQRVIVEICCTNLDYEARNLVKERQVEGVDIVLGITPNRRLREALERAVEKAKGAADADRNAAALVLLDAGECLAKDFDWMTVLERPS